jgi:hypothetical protein
MEKNIENLDLARRVLSALPRIDKRIEAECNYTKRIARNSWNGVESTLVVTQRIIDHTYKIWQLHNLKIRAERIIEYAPKQIRRTIEVFFLMCPNIPDAAHKLKMSMRSTTRLVTEAIEYFAQTMPKSMSKRELRSLFL